MSTRSGKRIHASSQENTVGTDAGAKRERKTRSKHTNENLEEFDVSTQLKRRHYVGHPGDDAEVDTVDYKDDTKTSHVPRKTALKERNISSADSTEPSDCRKSLRSTRRTPKFPELEDAATQNNENKEDNQKPKKGKKKIGQVPLEEVVVSKKKKIGQVPLEEVVVSKKKKIGQVPLEEGVVSKKKSKKRKGRRSNSMVVEEVEAETPSGINKSNMSVDSFHSAAGSPSNTNNHNSIATSLKKDSKVNSAMEIEEITKTETRKTRSTMTLDTNNVKEKESSKRSSVKKSLGNHLKNDSINNGSAQNTFDRDLSKHRSSVKDVVMETSGFSKSIINSNEEMLQDQFGEENIDNFTFDKTLTPNITNTTFDKDADEIVTSAKKSKKRKSMAANLIAPNISLEAADEDKSSVNTTFDKDVELENKGKKRKSQNDTQLGPGRSSIIDVIFDFNATSPFIASSMKLEEDSKIKSVINTTYEKDEEPSFDLEAKSKKNSVNATFDIMECSANEVSSSLERNTKHEAVINTTYEKDSDTDTTKRESVANDNIEDKILKPEIKINNTTFEKDQSIVEDSDVKIKRKSLLRLSSQVISVDKESKSSLISSDNTFDKESKSSIISSDNSMITLDKSDASRISITSDDSKHEENIINTTPLLIESSLEESKLNITPPQTEVLPAMTPLKRDGTFTKDESEVIGSPKPRLSKTPTKQMSLPSAGFTPFHVKKSSKEKSVLMNVTRSLEKSRRSSLAEPLPRATKVMFCSPANNPAVVAQNGIKVIKSNLKGSNKSFIFNDSVTVSAGRPGRAGGRKRSYTQGDAEDGGGKRTRLADTLQQSVERLSRPRAGAGAAVKSEPSTPSKKATPTKKDRVLRTKLPDFAALHQRQFDQMESLGDCQKRRARRARRLLTPSGAVSVLDRISPRDNDPEPAKPKEAPKKPETPVKSLPTLKSLNPGYTRFGFKLNLDVNPFSIPSKSEPKPKEKQPNGLRKALPSIAGATSVRKEVAKQTVMREKSFSGRRDVTRTENRTVIKGVRTNRRFELQMRMRDL